MKEHFEYIFVVLTYRNGEDLYEFVNSIKKHFESYHFIVVNSFYDEDTEKRIRKIAKDINGIFISVENKGYGAGNNVGIKYAMDHYSFDYLVVANSDLIVKSFDSNKLPRTNSIIGPRILTLTGKAQNPYWNKRRLYIEKLLYMGHKKKSKWYLYIGQGLNRIYREVFLFVNKCKIKQIYAVHGACVIFTRDVVEKLYPVYDENMFLYYEEAYLAKKALCMDVNVIYYPMLKVLHKEDGSTKGLNLDLSKHATDSYLYYFELPIMEGIETFKCR